MRKRCLLEWNRVFNTLRPRQNGRHFADDTFKRIFLNENVRISIKISLKFVPKDPIHNIPALVQIMAWRRSGDKPLSEPMMVSLLTHIYVTRPQWVKAWINNQITVLGDVNNSFPPGNVTLILYVYFSHAFLWLLSWVFPVLLPLGKWHWSLLLYKSVLVQVMACMCKYQAITWTAFDQDLWHHVVSLGYNELTIIIAGLSEVYMKCHLPALSHFWCLQQALTCQILGSLTDMFDAKPLSQPVISYHELDICKLENLYQNIKIFSPKRCISKCSLQYISHFVQASLYQIK